MITLGAFDRYDARPLMSVNLKPRERADDSANSEPEVRTLYGIDVKCDGCFARVA
jgi:hypothetical protein